MKLENNHLGIILKKILTNTYIFLNGWQNDALVLWLMACRQRGCSTVHRKVFFCKMDTRDKAIKPSKYDFSTVFRLKENRQNLIHGMCHVLVVLHELTLLHSYTIQKRRDPKIFPPSIAHSDLIVVGIFQTWKKLRTELIYLMRNTCTFFSAKPILVKTKIVAILVLRDIMTFVVLDQIKCIKIGY